MTINVKLESKRYCCYIQIKEKVTFIQGESGKGKTEFTRRISSGSSANKLDVSNGYEIIVFTKALFYQSRDIALKHNTHNEDRIKFLTKYWGDRDNFPYENKILVVDEKCRQSWHY